MGVNNPTGITRDWSERGSEREMAAAEASNVDGGGDNDDEELDAINREGS